MDKEISALAEKLSSQTTTSGRKKITVLDFTDLQGGINDLGRFLAEQLSVSVVENRKNFSVMDRANLKTILAEHKLTVEGLVEPENAKKLGQFSGVDAIVLGTITILKDEIMLSVKLIATDTAEIVGAAKARIPKSQDVELLLARASSAAEQNALTGRSEQPAKGRDAAAQPSPVVPKDSLGYQARRLFFHLESIREVKDSGRSLRFLEATLSVLNTDPANSAAFTMVGSPLATLTDDNGNIFEARGPGYESEYVSPNIATRLKQDSLSVYSPNQKAKMTIRLFNYDHNRGQIQATEPMRLIFEIWVGEYLENNLSKPAHGSRQTIWIDTKKN